MSLTPGTSLGPYEILAPIGAGGMGEVYRGTDTNLKRPVALKVLLPSVTGDPDRLAKMFVRCVLVMMTTLWQPLAVMVATRRGGRLPSNT